MVFITSYLAWRMACALRVGVVLAAEAVRLR